MVSFITFVFKPHLCQIKPTFQYQFRLRHILPILSLIDFLFHQVMFKESYTVKPVLAATCLDHQFYSFPSLSAQDSFDCNSISVIIM